MGLFGRFCGKWEGVVADAAESVLGYQSVLPSAWEGRSHDHLARELHDGVAGELSTMLLDLERFRSAQVGRNSVLVEISLLQDQVRGVLANVRKLLYAERELPGVEPDFIGSLRRGIARRYTERTSLRVRVLASPAWPSEIPADTALNLRRIIQEALNNVARHSGAGTVSISFSMMTGIDWAVLRVSDDGRGSTSQVDGWQAGFGLMGISERALLLGARIEISNRRRGGSILTVAIPRRRLAI
jgi:two-component system sensor histidine kinase UhpB